MKKSLLSQSIATLIGGLALAGAANAAVSFSGDGVALTTTNATQLDIRPGGIGHIGVVPYFTTQNGSATLLSITNTDDSNGKLLKVRFRSAANSDDIFDFSLFLSPSDIWTANISRSEGATNLSFLTTNDKSCTLPFNVNGDFITNRLPAVSPDFPAATQASWTREGYIEILNAADVPPLLAPGAVGAGTANPLFKAIKHENGIAPCATGASAAVINALANNPATPAAAATLGLDTPSGGIYTNATIVNTRNAFVAWSTESTAIAAVVAGAGATVPPTTGRGRLVFAPQTGATATFPQGGTQASFTADPLLQAAPAAGGIAPLEFDFPDLSTPYVNTAVITAANGALAPEDSASQANELSASLAVSSINNDYTTLAGFAGKTDFTFSFPTRRYGVAVSYAGVAPAFGTPVVLENTGNNYFRSTTAAPTSPATSTAAPNVTRVGRLACVSPGTGVNQTATAAYDREERGQVSSGFVISPGGPGATVQFCGEVSVLTFNNPSPGVGTLSAEVAVQNITTGFEEGWARISTPGRANGVGSSTFGLPILGSAYVQARGPVETGRSTTFGWTYKHKAVPVSRTPAAAPI